ncbi:hypothetical protein QAD02_024356 [Eretmocerus hayati]|uniref:Uncharacterized protein n=1 Tax=Eretmocerus hayati TaxID=131215 RepID=A0ACC2Q047_9HYME|nr:hypothetical protein QAD02_024356 [Eretmocerus hayati]
MGRLIRCNTDSRKAYITQLAAAVYLVSLLFSCTCDGHHNKLSNRLTRHIRSLGFPSGSGMGMFFAVSIPVDIPNRSVSMSWYFEANYPLPTANDTLIYAPIREKRSPDRSVFYEVLQNKLESFGYPGRACLLRTICEAAKFPFTHNGLLGDFIRILFTPSTSLRDDLLHPELEAAEFMQDCKSFNKVCPVSLLDAISSGY